LKGGKIGCSRKWVSGAKPRGRPILRHKRPGGLEVEEMAPGAACRGQPIHNAVIAHLWRMQKANLGGKFKTEAEKQRRILTRKKNCFTHSKERMCSLLGRGGRARGKKKRTKGGGGRKS